MQGVVKRQEIFVLSIHPRIFRFQHRKKRKLRNYHFFVPCGFKMLPVNFCRMSAVSKAEIEFVFLMAIYEILQMHNFRIFGLKFLILLE